MILIHSHAMSLSGPIGVIISHWRPINLCLDNEGFGKATLCMNGYCLSGRVKKAKKKKLFCALKE